jgi:hypothetical protein
LEPDITSGLKQIISKANQHKNWNHKKNRAFVYCFYNVSNMRFFQPARRVREKDRFGIIIDVVIKVFCFCPMRFSKEKTINEAIKLSDFFRETRVIKPINECTYY